MSCNPAIIVKSERSEDGLLDSRLGEWRLANEGAKRFDEEKNVCACPLWSTDPSVVHP